MAGFYQVGKENLENPQIQMTFKWQEGILPAQAFTAFNPKPRLLQNSFQEVGQEDPAQSASVPASGEMKEQTGEAWCWDWASRLLPS